MKIIAGTIAAFVVLQGCSDQEVATNTVAVESAKQDEPEYPEFLHADPTGEGMELANFSNKNRMDLPAATPVISVSDKWVVQDRADMAALVAESVSILTDPRLAEYGRALKADYPKAWFAQSLGFGDAERVADMVGRPADPVRYLPASVVPFSGWAQTGGREGRVAISVNPKLLERWRSSDVVMRSCAVNTMAHEISHTLSRSTTTYLYAFTDTGVGREARATAPASYLAGNIALYGYLIRQGRIQPADLKQCVAIWYQPGGFQSGQCDAFPGDTPIR